MGHHGRQPCAHDASPRGGQRRIPTQTRADAREVARTHGPHCVHGVHTGTLPVFLATLRLEEDAEGEWHARQLRPDVRDNRLHGHLDD